ncbi:MAG: hypothetical protein LBR07_01455 [Puniceicoccales bacterium]|jgi:hypothetical protein|nr:hypothetical protein [Puniceicoccales bacterium]
MNSTSYSIALAHPNFPFISALPAIHDGRARLDEIFASGRAEFDAAQRARARAIAAAGGALAFSSAFFDDDHTKCTQKALRKIRGRRIFKKHMKKVAEWLTYWNHYQDKNYWLRARGKSPFDLLERHCNRPLSQDAAVGWRANAADWTRRYQDYLAAEMKVFDDQLAAPPTPEGAAISLAALGRLTHSWQDFFTHIIGHDKEAAGEKTEGNSTGNSDAESTGGGAANAGTSDEGTATGDDGPTLVKDVFSEGLVATPASFVDERFLLLPSSYGDSKLPAWLNHIFYSGEHGLVEHAGYEGQMREEAAIVYVADRYAELLPPWAEHFNVATLPDDPASVPDPTLGTV